MIPNLHDPAQPPLAGYQSRVGQSDGGGCKPILTMVYCKCYPIQKTLPFISRVFLFSEILFAEAEVRFLREPNKDCSLLFRHGLQENSIRLVKPD